jgi:hypothetical protein
MADNRPDPGEFFDLAQRMLRELFGDRGGMTSRGRRVSSACCVTRSPRTRPSRHTSPPLCPGQGAPTPRAALGGLARSPISILDRRAMPSVEHRLSDLFGCRRFPLATSQITTVWQPGNG